MPKYKVSIWRSEYSLLTFDVEAENKTEAEELALSEAFHTEYPPGRAEYDVDEILTKTDEDHSTED